MPQLTRRVEVLFSEEMAVYLKEVAERERASVGTLIRKAVQEKYNITSNDDKLAAVERLYALEAPVGEWALMEREITAGAQA
ncbi:MAG: hypothetical protein OXE49_08000 [Gemmatimonadetes bacterium]|nr:hypothetical protein [Gemmatimonadota bacterium]